MSLVQPNIIAEALGITSNALRKRRVSGKNTDNFDYIVTESGRALYKYDSLPPSVRVNVDKITTTRKKQAHEDRMKSDFRYANSIGKYNARRKALIQKEIDIAVGLNCSLILAGALGELVCLFESSLPPPRLIKSKS